MASQNSGYSTAYHTQWVSVQNKLCAYIKTPKDNCKYTNNILELLNIVNIYILILLDIVNLFILILACVNSVGP